jgi:hypothetical protein
MAGLQRLHDRLELPARLIDPTDIAAPRFPRARTLRWLRAGDASSILFFTVFGMLSLQRLLADPVFKTLFVPE